MVTHRPSRPVLAALAVPLLAACSSAPPDAPAPPAAVSSASVLEGAVAALGGAEVVDGVLALRLVGTSLRTLPGGRVDQGPVHSVIAFPDRYRQEIQGRVGPLSTMLTPDGAFLVAVGMMLPLPEEQRAWMAASLRRNPVRLLQLRDDPGFELGLTPKAVSEEEIVLEVALHGEWLALTFDRESGAISRIAVPDAQVPETGVGEYVLTFADWREVEGGLRYPFVTTATFSGSEVFRTQLATVEVNPEIPPEIWASAATTVADPPPADAPAP